MTQQTTRARNVLHWKWELPPRTSGAKVHATLTIKQQKNAAILASGCNLLEFQATSIIFSIHYSREQREETNEIVAQKNENECYSLHTKCIEMEVFCDAVIDEKKKTKARTPMMTE